MKTAMTKINLPGRGSSTLRVFPYIGQVEGIPKFLYKQQEQIAKLVDKNNLLLVCAPTGAGKTTCLLLYALNKIMRYKKAWMEKTRAVLKEEGIPEDVADELCEELLRGGNIVLKQGKPWYSKRRNFRILPPTFGRLKKHGLVKAKAEGKEIVIEGPPVRQGNIVYCYNSQHGFLTATRLIEKVAHTIPITATDLVITDLKNLFEAGRRADLVIVDDIHLCKDIQRLKVLLNYLCFKNEGVKIVLTTAPVENPDDLAKYLMGKEATVFSAGAHLGTVKITVCATTAKKPLHPEKLLEKQPPRECAVNIDYDVIHPSFIVDYMLADVKKPLERRQLFLVSRHGTISARLLKPPISPLCEPSEWDLLCLLRMCAGAGDKKMTSLGNTIIRTLLEMKRAGLVSKKGNIWKLTKKGERVSELCGLLSIPPATKCSVISKGKYEKICDAKMAVGKIKIECARGRRKIKWESAGIIFKEGSAVTKDVLKKAMYALFGISMHDVYEYKDEESRWTILYFAPAKASAINGIKKHIRQLASFIASEANL